MAEQRAEQVWRDYVASGRCRADIPHAPDVVYADEWQGWCHWLRWDAEEIAAAEGCCCMTTDDPASPHPEIGGRWDPQTSPHRRRRGFTLNWYLRAVPLSSTVIHSPTDGWQWAADGASATEP